jgi:8-oxo-dGTP diphosphatase
MAKNYIGYVTTKAVIKYREGYVLVRQQDEDKWILPGGRMDFGETPDECILREIKEEISLNCKIEKIISLNAYQGKEGKLPKLFAFYLVTPIDENEIRVNNEIVEYAIISKKEDLEKFRMYQNQMKAIEGFLE